MAAPMMRLSFDRMKTNHVADRPQTMEDQEQRRDGRFLRQTKQDLNILGIVSTPVG